MPSGSAVGMSLAEWTARSIRPASSASSISLVNSPLPPASASGRSVMRSPVVRIGSTLTGNSGRRQRLAHGFRLDQRQRAAARSERHDGGACVGRLQGGLSGC